MEELAAGIRRVTLPLPTRPGHVHAYLLPGDEGWTLVDTGIGTPDAKETWAAELEQAGGRVDDHLRHALSPRPHRCGRGSPRADRWLLWSSRARSTTHSASSCGGIPAWA